MSLKVMNRLFGGGDSNSNSALPIVDEEADALWEQVVAETEEEEQELSDSLAPGERRVISAPIISDDVGFEESEEILIVAQPDPAGDQCVFRMNRVLMENCSWYFEDAVEVKNSPLAAAVFALGKIESVLVCESMLIVSSSEGTLRDWEPLARKVGAAVRSVFESGVDLIAAELLGAIPSAESIRVDIQQVIDDVVNPGVAGHGGDVSIVDVRGNSVTIKMGGGCQGCSAADMTLKQGIHTSFRNAVPGVGAIFDETDHSAGLNPYFS